MLILFVIDQIKIEYIRNPVYPYWVWLFFGLIVASSRIVAEESPIAEPAKTGSTAARKRPLAVAPVSPLFGR